MLKSADLNLALAQCFVQNPQLWKEFNDAVRLLFRGQAFPDQFIKGYFEQLQTNINRERGSNRAPRQVQRVNNNHQPQIHHMNQFNQFNQVQRTFYVLKYALWEVITNISLLDSYLRVYPSLMKIGIMEPWITYSIHGTIISIFNGGTPLRFSKNTKTQW